MCDDPCLGIMPIKGAPEASERSASVQSALASRPSNAAVALTMAVASPQPATLAAGRVQAQAFSCARKDCQLTILLNRRRHFKYAVYERPTPCFVHIQTIRSRDLGEAPDLLEIDIGLGLSVPLGRLGRHITMRDPLSSYSSIFGLLKKPDTRR